MHHSINGLLKALDMPLRDDDIILSSVTADSRKVTPSGVFVAERGVNVDGHDYIGRAIDAGAAVIICENIPEGIDPGSEIFITVTDSVDALGKAAAWWYGYPSEELTLVGVTGTNGKTTIATLLYEMARMLGHKAGLLSTVENKIDTLSVPSTHTTPDILTINSLLRRMVDSGCTFCAMEVSSHACQQRRIAGLHFDGGIFTNITRDHLDYHKTFANYLQAKKSFFDSLPASAFALTNADDRNGAVMLQNTEAKKATYSIQRPANYNGKLIEPRLDGMTMAFGPTEVETAFVGRFNASNLTAVYAAALLCGWPREEVLTAISRLVPVAGRMQTLSSPSGVTAIIDYAHTPDALANVLATIRDAAPAARIITVAGAGGDRDKGKRPLMAAEAARRSDTLIITSDNPRHESAAQIAAEMLDGVPAGSSADVHTILDRREAIRHAVAIAAPGDVVLIAGKGHETYQIIGDTRHHFDDREEAAAALAALTPSPSASSSPMPSA